ncbi:MAG: thiamine phosphate synthase [Magnetococcales bacterium]|nr:thiamine phosphate synthase [Magnetococcales bacterium]
MAHSPQLLLITDTPLRADLETVLSQALKGGSFDLLLRDKSASAATLVAVARRLKPILHAAGGRLLIHDRVDIALTTAADGVHLPEAGLTSAEARYLLGPIPLLGRSCHETTHARQHLLHGGNYVTLSPVFATASHPDATPLGVTRFATMRADIPGPVLALGGIHGGNVRAALEAGATGVALIRGIFNAPDPAEATWHISRAIQGT